MSKDKIQTVLNFPIPKNLSLLRSFLGLANYFRQFIPMHSTMVKPMHDMIDHTAAKRSAIVWTQESTNAFLDTRIAISRCPLMHFTDDQKMDARLYTDASNFGIGGVLFQNCWYSMATCCFCKQVVNTDTSKLVNYTKRSVCNILLLYQTWLSLERSYVHYSYRSFEYNVYEAKSDFNGGSLVHCYARTRLHC